METGEAIFPRNFAREKGKFWVILLLTTIKVANQIYAPLICAKLIGVCDQTSLGNNLFLLQREGCVHPRFDPQRSHLVVLG